ncbi:MAG: hypothetical protein GWO20_08485 [Candidatus Korarchaeota archaeon]|nr:hypothetical protein [Candidatus Korarchaeota archaeon]NIW13248.1 hypothetical protein [Candidatus Thorarchaeota archaeon]
MKPLNIRQKMIVKAFLLICVFFLVGLSPVTTVTSLSDTNMDMEASSNSIPTFAFFNGNVTRTESDYSELKSSITSRGFDYKTVGQINSYETLVGVDVLITLGLEKMGGTGLNLSLVEKFLREGGSLLFAPSFKVPLAAENLLELIGLNTTSTLVEHNVTGKKEVVLSNTWNKTSYLYDEVSNITFVNGTMIKGADDDQKLINFTIKKHPTLWGNNTTILERREDDEELTGTNLTLVYECELWSGGRVVVLPSFSIVLNEFLTDNQQFATNVINWLAKRNNLIIENFEVHPNRVNLESENPEITVTFKLTDENALPIKVTNLTVILERLGETINASNVSTSETPDKATHLQLPSNIKPGLVSVFAYAYKPFYGFSWSNKLEITLYKSWLSQPSLRSKVILGLCFTVPGIISLFFILKSLPEYRANKKTLKELEKETTER